MSLLYCSDDHLWVLGTLSTLHMDGTHLTAGDPLHHIDVISERVNNQVIPLCFCLMTGKTVENYSAFFKTLKEAYVQLTGEQLQPEKIVFDFEIAVMIAVDEEFPGVFCSRCLFYMLQSLWRNAAQRGMTSLFEKGVVHEDEDESPCL
jgi:hypothetical protein